MAVISCPLCGSKVNAQAAHCPHCGADPLLGEAGARADLAARGITPAQSSGLESSIGSSGKSSSLAMWLALAGCGLSLALAATVSFSGDAWLASLDELPINPANAMARLAALWIICAAPALAAALCLLFGRRIAGGLLSLLAAVGGFVAVRFAGHFPVDVEGYDLRATAGLLASPDHKLAISLLWLVAAVPLVAAAIVAWRGRWSQG